MRASLFFRLPILKLKIFRPKNRRDARLDTINMQLFLTRSDFHDILRVIAEGDSQSQILSRGERLIKAQALREKRRILKNSPCADDVRLQLQMLESPSFVGYVVADKDPCTTAADEGAGGLPKGVAKLGFAENERDAQLDNINAQLSLLRTELHHVLRFMVEGNSGLRFLSNIERKARAKELREINGGLQNSRCAALHPELQLKESPSFVSLADMDKGHLDQV